MSNTIGGGNIFKSNNILPNLNGDSSKPVNVKDLPNTAQQITERASNGLNSRVNLNDYGTSMRFRLETRLANNSTNQTLSADNETKRNFETFGGDWRVRSDNGDLKFYPKGANVENTIRFDEEYFKLDETEFIHLNKNGALIDLPENAGKPQPENVKDLDWFGYERVTPNRVPADYTSTGKTIAFDNPQFANDKVNVLKRYVVDNNLLKGTWDEAKTNDASKLLLADGVKVEITELGKRGDGKTEYNIKIDEEGLRKLRTKLSEYKAAVASDVADGKAGQQEATKMARDLPRITYESGRETGETIVNVIQDTGNLVLSHPETVKKSDISFGRAKVGEMYDELSNVKRNPEYNNGTLPRIDTSPLKVEYESRMMNRNITGTDIKTGDAVSGVAGQIAPLKLGKVISPSKSVNGLQLGESADNAETLLNVTGKATTGTQNLSKFTNGKQLKGVINKEIQVGDKLPEGYSWHNGQIFRKKGKVDAGYAPLKMEEGKIALRESTERLSKLSVMNGNFKDSVRAELEKKYPNLSKEQIRAKVEAEKNRVQIHHVIPDELVKETELGRAAQKAGYNLDKADNLKGMPRTPEDKLGDFDIEHRGSHPNYTEEVRVEMNKTANQLKKEYKTETLENVPPERIKREMKRIEQEFRQKLENNDKSIPTKDGKLSILPPIDLRRSGNYEIRV